MGDAVGEVGADGVGAPDPAWAGGGAGVGVLGRPALAR